LVITIETMYKYIVDICTWFLLCSVKAYFEYVDIFSGTAISSITAFLIA